MKMTFNYVAYALKTSRTRTDYSQSDLAVKLGYRNGQFISNIERGLCNLPPHLIVKCSNILDVMPEKFIEAMAKDYEEALNQEVKSQLPILSISDKISPYYIP